MCIPSSAILNIELVGSESLRSSSHHIPHAPVRDPSCSSADETSGVIDGRLVLADVDDPVCSESLWEAVQNPFPFWHFEHHQKVLFPFFFSWLSPVFGAWNLHPLSVFVPWCVQFFWIWSVAPHLKHLGVPCVSWLFPLFCRRVFTSASDILAMVSAFVSP